MQKYNILVVKETRANEKRVALIPKDAAALIKLGHNVFIENGAGNDARFSNQDYKDVGCIIRNLDSGFEFNSYKNLFSEINVVVRAKRPERNREILENQAILPNTIMIGALDPLERNSLHIQDYQKAKIIAYSIDQMQLDSNDPMNLLAAMSKIAGKLALQDAIKKFKGNIKKVVIIGFGVVGRAVFDEAMAQKLPITIIVSRNVANILDASMYSNVQIVLLNKSDSVDMQQDLIKQHVVHADIVITSARNSNQVAPILISLNTLNAMQAGSVVVDMALSEGGNVEGSVHDATLMLGNGVIVTNTSGYPKAVPHEASILWSRITYNFILKLIRNEEIPLLPC